jgi:hypothetical protein
MPDTEGTRERSDGDRGGKLLDGHGHDARTPGVLPTRIPSLRETSASPAKTVSFLASPWSGDETQDPRLVYAHHRLAPLSGPWSA